MDTNSSPVRRDTDFELDDSLTRHNLQKPLGVQWPTLDKAGYTVEFDVSTFEAE